MVDKENPSSEIPPESASPVEAIYVSDSSGNGEGDNELDTSSGVVTALLVEEEPVIAVAPLRPENLAARGGAVASVVLGLWSIVGASITSYSMINAIIGMALGFWGMSSDVRWPWLGVVLCFFGAFICLIVSAVS